MAGDPLREYHRILTGTAKARYLGTKGKGIRIKLGADDSLLWSEHDRRLKATLPRDSGPTLMDLKCELAGRLLEKCTLCERKCQVNRKHGKKGHCGVLEPRISSEFLHMGEEPELVPSYTIFFAGCTFNCIFCQNWDISTRPDAGVRVAPNAVARMIEAKVAGRSGRKSGASARNVNWVGGDPTSNLPFILSVLNLTTANLPQIWNSNMYLSEESMRLLDGVIDVYLTDFKYGNDECAMRLSNAPEYLRIVRRNHLLAKEHGEVIVRHLVLPGHLECCTRPVLSWIADNLPNVKVNVMSQYRPAYRAEEAPEISAPLRLSEFRHALELAEELNLYLTG